MADLVEKTPASDLAGEPVKPGRKRADRRTPGKETDWRHEEIALAAYYCAERRGFQGNQALDDWLDAEKYIDTLDAKDGKRK